MTSCRFGCATPLADARQARLCCLAHAGPRAVWHDPAVEFLNFVLIFAAGYVMLRRPERERLAFGLLVTSSLLMAALFLIGARGSILPGVNY